ASESNAIHRPSGDQRGDPERTLCRKVSCTGFEPSLAATQISRNPLRSELNTIFLPSGENFGEKSSRVEVATGAAGRTTRTVPPAAIATSMRHMLKSSSARWYTSRTRDPAECAMAGEYADPSIPTTGCGSELEPIAARHNPAWPERLEEKMTSRLPN